MRAYNELLHDDETVAGEYRGAHRLYVAFRHELAVRLAMTKAASPKVSAGGHARTREMPACAAGADPGHGGRASTPSAIVCWRR